MKLSNTSHPGRCHRAPPHMSTATHTLVLIQAMYTFPSTSCLAAALRVLILLTALFRIGRAQLRDAPRFWKQRPDLREHIDNANVPWSGSTRAAKYTLGMISSTRAEETCSSGTARRGVVRQHVSWWAAEMVKPWGPGRAEGDSLRWRRL